MLLATLPPPKEVTNSCRSNNLAGILRHVHTPALDRRSGLRRAICRSCASSNCQEFEVKSAYLYNFAKWAQCPEHTLPNDKSKLVICVFGGERDFPDVLKSTLAGKDIREYPIEIRHLQSSGELKSCHLAFIRVANGNARAALAQLENTNVLSVGEDKEFLSQGGMIKLTLEDGGVRF